MTEVLHACHSRFEQVTHFPGQAVAFDNIGVFLDGLFKIGIGMNAQLAQLNKDKHVPAYSFWRNSSREAFDDPFFLKPIEALRDAWATERKLFG